MRIQRTAIQFIDLALALANPVTLVANLATHHLWGAGATPAQILGHLQNGGDDGPPPDWDVGHFACVFGRITGPGGVLYCVADTYPSLGNNGVHLQPQERLAAAIDRRDKPAGGVIVVLGADDASAVRAGARELGLQEGLWDNGTAAAERAGSA